MKNMQFVAVGTRRGALHVINLLACGLCFTIVKLGIQVKIGMAHRGLKSLYCLIEILLLCLFLGRVHICKIRNL